MGKRKVRREQRQPKNNKRRKGRTADSGDGDPRSFAGNETDRVQGRDDRKHQMGDAHNGAGPAAKEARKGSPRGKGRAGKGGRRTAGPGSLKQRFSKEGTQGNDKNGPDKKTQTASDGVRKVVNDVMAAWDMDERMKEFQEYVKKEGIEPLKAKNRYAAFWKALTEGTTDEPCFLEANTIWDLAENPWRCATDDVDLSKLYIRSAYNEVLSFILSPQHVGQAYGGVDFGRRDLHFIMTGTAGIGKSAMVPYALLVLYRCMRDKAMILMVVKDCCYVFLGDGSVYEVMNRKIAAACPWHLVDGKLDRNIIPPSTGCWRLHFTTYNENIRDLYKQKTWTEIVVFPWMKEEVDKYCQLRPFVGPRKADIEKRFELYGGKARSVFGTKTLEKLDRAIDNGIEKLFEGGVKIPKECNPKSAVDRVLYRVRGEGHKGTFWHDGMPDTPEPIYDCGSEYIQKKLLDYVVKKGTKWSIIDELIQQGVPDVAGRLLEDLVHGLFKNSRTVSFNSETGRVEIANEGWKEYEEGCQVEIGSYYRTPRNSPTIDSFIMRQGGKVDVFQISAQAKGRKEINLSKRLAHLHLQKSKVQNVYYVVYNLSQHAKLHLVGSPRVPVSTVCATNIGQ